MYKTFKLIKLILAFFVMQITYAQWEYKEYNNAFDGSYKLAAVIGEGYKFPYESPILYVRKWDISQEIDVFIINSGYYPHIPEVTVKFENETLFYNANASLSSDNETVFISSFKDNFSKFQFIDKLKKGSKLFIRIQDNYSSKDYSFSLNGSGLSISKVIPNLDSILEERAKINNAKISYNNLLLKKKDSIDNYLLEKKDSIDNYLLEKIKQLNLEEESFTQVEYKILNTFDVEEKIYKQKIDSIFLESAYKGNRFLNVKSAILYASINGSNKNLGYVKVTENNYLYKRYLNQKIDRENNIERLKTIIRNKGIKEIYFNTILMEIEAVGIEFNEIKDLYLVEEGLSKSQRKMKRRNVFVVTETEKHIELVIPYGIEIK